MIIQFKKFRYVILTFVLMLLSVIYHPLISSAQDSHAVSGKHSFYVSAAGGLGVIMSDVISGWTSGNPHIGGDWQLMFGWISPKTFGGGLLYSGYCSKGKTAAETNSYYGPFRSSLYMHYIAPQLLYRRHIRQSPWSLEIAVGLGAAFVVDNETARKGQFIVSARDTSTGFGSNLMLGGGYDIVHNMSLLVHLSSENFYITNKKTKDKFPDRTNGISRIGIDFGLTYTF